MFNVYPEQLHAAWYNILDDGVPRRTLLDAQDQEDWNGVVPVSTRTGIPLNLKPLNNQKLQEIVATANSREDFHNYNTIMGAPKWGHCLCELRFITGADCIQYLCKGALPAPVKGAMPKNKHWAMFIDPAPRGFLCPFMRTAWYATMGLQRTDTSFQKCDVLIGKPTEDWILAQRPNAPNGALPGRAVTDIVLPGKCLRCENANAPIDEYNMLHSNQFSKMDLSIPFCDIPITKPVQYKPEGTLRHPTLEGGTWYRYRDLSMAYGVPDSDIWKEGSTAENKKDMTMEDW
jgi:hypothetical protein